jgi:hypothetical protein
VTRDHHFNFVVGLPVFRLRCETFDCSRPTLRSDGPFDGRRQPAPRDFLFLARANAGKESALRRTVANCTDGLPGDEGGTRFGAAALISALCFNSR